MLMDSGSTLQNAEREKGKSLFYFFNLFFIILEIMGNVVVGTAVHKMEKKEYKLTEEHRKNISLAKRGKSLFNKNRLIP